jgi:hypothetical protein
MTNINLKKLFLKTSKSFVEIAKEKKEKEEAINNKKLLLKWLMKVTMLNANQVLYKKK